MILPKNKVCLVDGVASQGGRKLSSSALVTAVLCLIVPMLGAADAEDKLIVPGVRIGSVHLGIKETALYEQFGGPSAVRSAPGYISYVYPQSGLTVYIDAATHEVFEIDVAQNSEYRTLEDIAVGSSMSNVQTKLGPRLNKSTIR